MMALIGGRAHSVYSQVRRMAEHKLGNLSRSVRRWMEPPETG